MRATERDSLLGRLDERTVAILSAQEETRDHLKMLNGKVATNTQTNAVQAEQIKVANHRIKNLECTGVPAHVKFTRRQYVIGGSGLSAVLGTVIIGVGSCVGWW